MKMNTTQTESAKKEIAISTEANDFVIEQPIAVIQGFRDLAQALADVAKAAGNPRGAAIMAALATCIGAAVQMHGSGAARPPRGAKPKRKAAKRQPARA